MKNVRLLGLILILNAACAQAPHPRTVPLGSRSVFIDDARGGGIPVVFIHGNGGSSEQWSAQIDHLRRAGTRAVAIDLPGFGKSSAPPGGDLSLQAMARAVDDVTTAIHLRRFVIVGHSYGGAVVATYAAMHPERVAGVIYVDSAATAPSLTEEQKAKFTAALQADKMGVVHAWFAPILKPSTQSVQDAVFASVERTSADSLIGALISLGAFEPKKLVDAYIGPRLAIVATDIETPQSFQNQFPEIEAVPITSAGHWVMLDKPQEVNAAIDSFLSKVRSRS